MATSSFIMYSSSELSTSDLRIVSRCNCLPRICVLLEASQIVKQTAAKILKLHDIIITNHTNSRLSRVTYIKEKP